MSMGVFGGMLRIRYELDCPSPQRLFADLAECRIEAVDIVAAGDRVRLSVSVMQRRRFERLAAERKIGCTVIEEGLLCRLPCIAAKRAGLVVGGFVCAAAVFAAQYFLLTIDVLTDSDDLRSEVMNVMLEEGVTVGRRISTIEPVELERALKQRVGGISWAGVSITDSRLIIDVIENTDPPENGGRRLPSNLVAKHSGTIEEIELYNGLLKVPLGSGVLRGELLVSGRIPSEETVERDGKLVREPTEKYVRSIGTLRGCFTEEQTFEQPYTEKSITMNGKRDDRRCLRVFGAELPLFFGGDKELYIETESYSPLTFFDEELPVGLKTVKREGFTINTVLYTKEQALERACKAAELYEQNFLEGEGDRIISKKTDVKYTKEGVKLTVFYELYGVMSEEKEFFIKK